jgi:hypothetical protein
VHSSIVILSEAQDLSGSPRLSLMHHPRVFLMHSSIVILSKAKDLSRWAEMLSAAKHGRTTFLCYLLWKDVINMWNDITSNLATDGGSTVILIEERLLACSEMNHVVVALAIAIVVLVCFPHA